MGPGGGDGLHQLRPDHVAARHSDPEPEAVSEAEHRDGRGRAHHIQGQASPIHGINGGRHILPDEVQRLSA